MPLQYVEASADDVSVPSIAAVRDLLSGSVLVVFKPSSWVPSTFRFLVTFNGAQGTGFRNVDIGGSGGTRGTRLSVGRDTSNLFVSALAGDIPFGAANRWLWHLITFDTAGADSDQHIYCGSIAPFNAPLEVSTYADRTAGSGTVTTSPTTAFHIGNNGIGTGAPPAQMAVVGIWSQILGLTDLSYLMRTSDFAQGGAKVPLRLWLPGADGASTVIERIGSGDDGTISGAKLTNDFAWSYNSPALRPVMRPRAFAPSRAR